MIYSVVLVSIAVFAVAYVIYGRFIARQINLDNTRITPAHELSDGADFVPARAPLLLWQHFSAIAAAGPTVGPILAGIWFGWLSAAEVPIRLLARSHKEQDSSQPQIRETSWA